jgi:hypothetical protein
MCDNKELAPSPYAHLSGDAYFLALFGADQEATADTSHLVDAEPSESMITADETAIALNGFANHYYRRALERGSHLASRRNSVA